MAVEIFTAGGYDEVGRNMTVVRAGKTSVVMDMGIYLENYIRLTRDEDIRQISTTKLSQGEAIPNLDPIREVIKEVKAIMPSHAHLDHIGAIPFLSNKFKAPIISTPYTHAVLSSILKDERIRLKNRLEVKQPNTFFKIKDIKVEFIPITHSTPHTVMIALHTSQGIILYANDFKLDLYPVIGKKPSLKRLKELGKKGVTALVVESIYADYHTKTPSESVAKKMLRDVLFGTKHEGALVVTTFSSHIARLQSIVKLGQKLNRKILFLGRSLAKYVSAAQSIGLADFAQQVELFKYRSKIEKVLKRVEKEGKHKYLLVATGHQGEPGSTLQRITAGEYPFKFVPGDQIIFSCKTIPTPVNLANRAKMERRLLDSGARIFKDVHVSGHAAREDLRDLIELVKPQQIIPAHGPKSMRKNLLSLGLEIGYEKSNILMMNNGDKARVRTEN